VKILTKKEIYDLRFTIYNLRLIFFSILIFVLSSCKSRPSPPEGTIDTETMSKILVEIHVAETKVNRLGVINFDSTKAAYKYFESQIMLKYKTDTAQYRKSYDFYAANPEYLIDIYDDVTKILEKEKGDLDKSQQGSNLKPTR
jgi:hypothetical protein